jgi:predicted nucleic acid-binding protein
MIPWNRHRSGCPKSAIEGGARWLLSEDLRDGQRIGALTIRNPFLHE